MVSVKVNRYSYTKPQTLPRGGTTMNKQKIAVGLAVEPLSEQLLVKRTISKPAIVPSGTGDRLLPPSWRRPALIGVKAVHSLIYFSIEFCMGYLIYARLKGREDRRTAIAA